VLEFSKTEMIELRRQCNVMLRVDLEWEIQRMRAGVKAKNWVMNPYISIY